MKMFKGKRALVIGASGLIGSSLVSELLNNNAEVVAMGRSRNKLEEVFSCYQDEKRFSICEGDINSGIDKGLGFFDYVFQAASPISGAEIKERPLDTIDANLSGVRYCLEYLKDIKEKTGKSGRLVVFSSATVYGNVDSDTKSFSEDSTDNGEKLSASAIAYSESKRMIEVIAGAYAKQFDLDICIIRPSYVYGYSYNMPNTAFYEFIRKAIHGEDIVIHADRMAKRDNIYVSDVVSGIMKVALNGVKGEAYNIATNGEGGNYLSACEMAEIVKDCVNKEYGKNISVIYAKKQCESVPGVLLNNDKLKKLGWNLTVDATTGIFETVKKYYENEVVL
ncbi:NAD-dependent epimerase/dehydratase family protein [Butyrivibrio sp. WCD2001]|uniref:NAD-dependent epimerase/dehydratase family protein n=1 Tax=Butyrivibrio sp. WCD2001 TaxID=1280681 RepID=UPI00047EC1BF|nr:NAD(P)-dependent oxidoreductase [Butyrivibrio sp. WCD2001]